MPPLYLSGKFLLQYTKLILTSVYTLFTALITADKSLRFAASTNAINLSLFLNSDTEMHFQVYTITTIRVGKTNLLCQDVMSATLTEFTGLLWKNAGRSPSS